MPKLPEDLTMAELLAMAQRLGCELKITLEPIPKVTAPPPIKTGAVSF